MPQVKLTPRDKLAEIAANVQFEKYPDWSVDQLLCHPSEAIDLCSEVRRRMGKGPVAQFYHGDYEILSGLLNLRKRSRLPERVAPRRRRK